MLLAVVPPLITAAVVANTTLVQVASQRTIDTTHLVSATDADAITTDTTGAPPPPNPVKALGGSLKSLGGVVGALAANPDKAQASSTGSLPAAAASTAAAPGQVVTATAQVMAIGSKVSVRPEIAFLGTTGSVVDVVDGQAEEASLGAWSATVPVIGLAPAGTAVATLRLVAANGLPTDSQDTSITATTFATPDLAGPLHTTGNQILDANGNPVVLRGVDFTDLLSSSPYLYEHEFAAAKAWGANLVRLSLNEALWLTSSCTYSAGYVSKIDEVVDWITSLGMVALLDLHFNAPMVCQQGAQQDMADSPGSLEFWNQLATRYGQNPLVAFDLYNEPHNISDSIWLNGGQAMDTIPYDAAGMQALYNTVRATGAQGLVFVSGNNWANTVPANLVSGTNIVYSAHAYTCPNVAPPKCTSKAPYDPATILDNWLQISATLPVFVGEFGWPNPNDAAYTQAVIAFAQAHGWGWDAFAWNTSSTSVFDLVAQAPATAWEPTASGMPVLAAMAGVSF